MVDKLPFPAVGLETGLNGTPIYGGTISINALLHTLRETVNNPAAPTFTTILVNAYTLVASAMEKGAPETLNAAKQIVNQDMEVLTAYLKAYSTQRGVDPKVVVYLPEYNLLDSHLRNLSGKSKVTLKTYHELKKSIELKENTVSFGPYAIMKCGLKTLPHLILPKVLKSHVSFSCTAMFTHVYLDLHLRDVIGRSSMFLLERYTGKIIGATNFNKKIDSGGNIPFFKGTHAVFGDSTLQPIVSGKVRTGLIKDAETDNWTQRTEDDILKRIALKLTPEQKATLLERMNLI